MTRVLVTGAAAALGREVALALAARGHALTLADRDETGLAAIVAEIAARHPVPVESLVTDLSASINVQVLAMECMDVEALVAVAGGSGIDAAEEGTRRRAWATRVFGALTLAREMRDELSLMVLPLLEETEGPYGVHRAMANGALTALARTLEAEGASIVTLPFATSIEATAGAVAALFPTETDTMETSDQGDGGDTA